jgi:F-type H+-transporting ATPase subunit b
MNRVIVLAALLASAALSGPALAQEEEHTPAAVIGHEQVHEEAEAGHEEQGGHGHDISQIKWLPSTAEDDERDYPAYVWMVINFIVLAGLLFFAGRKTVAKFLKERRDRLMASIDEASLLKKEAEGRHAEFTEKLDRMKEEEGRIREDLVTSAEREKERLIADAGTRAEKMRAEARQLVERERAEAQLVLRRETADKAVGVARGILVKKIGPGEHRRLVDDYMKLLDTQVKS